MGPVQIQMEELQRKYPGATAASRPDGSFLVQIPNYPLPAGWNNTSTTVYFLAPVGYPHARPDCFWTDPELRLATGAMPLNASQNSNAGVGRDLLWFSYHAASWDPNQDGLLSYARMIEMRLREPR